MLRDGDETQKMGPDGKPKSKNGVEQTLETIELAKKAFPQAKSAS